MSDWATADALHRVLATAESFERRGRVIWAYGGAIKATGLAVRIGQSCHLLDPSDAAAIIPAEVIGFSDGAAILAPLKPLRGLSLDAEVAAGPNFATIDVGPGLLGRVIDAQGEPLDGLGPIVGARTPQAIYAEAPEALGRRPIDAVLCTGVKVLDGLLSVGCGQRVGVFSTAGAGKSTLLGMVARSSRSDANVIALIGERGREVGEFISDTLGPEGLKRSVVVVATSDRSAMERIRAANVATAVAESFRDQGLETILLMDSVTRYARALRELGLAMGEPAVRRGFPPSVFVELPRLLERAGAVRRGSITGFYAVLLEEENDQDPVGEEVRSILDGHIYLSRKIAETGRYPAVDVAASVSRLFHRLVGASHLVGAARLRAWLAKLEEIEFLRQVGEYKPGGDLEADEAIARTPRIQAFLRQASDEAVSLEDSKRLLQDLVA